MGVAEDIACTSIYQTAQTAIPFSVPNIAAMLKCRIIVYTEVLMKYEGGIQVFSHWSKADRKRVGW